MMHIHKLKKYYFINEFNQNHLISLNKNISFIWRNKDKETPINTLIKLRDFCKKNQRSFYISNNAKLAERINANGVYISSTNRNLNLRTNKFKKKFKILGSAHNLKEIKIKEPNWCTPFKSVPGVLMEYRVERFNVIMHFTAVEVEKSKIKDTEFLVPKKYKEISIDAMEKNLEELKDI